MTEDERKELRQERHRLRRKVRSWARSYQFMTDSQANRIDKMVMRIEQINELLKVKEGS